MAPKNAVRELGLCQRQIGGPPFGASGLYRKKGRKGLDVWFCLYEYYGKVRLDQGRRRGGNEASGYSSRSGTMNFLWDILITAVSVVVGLVIFNFLGL